jgi:hypothetical protein
VSDVVARVEAALGRRISGRRRPQTGLSAAERFVAQLDDGRAVFVKAAVDDATEAWLRRDHVVMSAIDGDFVPEVVAWLDDGAHPILVLEALGDAHWPADHDPVEWKSGQVDLLLAALGRVAATPPPSDLPSLADGWTPAWPALVASPDEFLALGVCTRQWFDNAAAAITRAEATLDTSGDALVHGDVRSDNVCFVGDRVVLVDWSEARRGSARFDVWNLAQTLPLETNVDPFNLAPDGAAFAATSAARNAERIYKQPDSLPPWLMQVLRRIVAIDLQWAARCLDLPPPDPQLVVG